MKAAAWPLVLSLLVTSSVASAAAPARSIEFHRSIEEARKAAKVERPTVLLFGATWCTWCRKMETDTLTDPKVMQAAGQFLWVKIDVDKDQELAARYGVDGVPVAVMIDNQGRVLGAQRISVAGQVSRFLIKEPGQPSSRGTAARSTRPLPEVAKSGRRAGNDQTSHSGTGQTCPNGPRENPCGVPKKGAIRLACVAGPDGQ